MCIEHLQLLIRVYVLIFAVYAQALLAHRREGWRRHLTALSMHELEQIKVWHLFFDVKTHSTSCVVACQQKNLVKFFPRFFFRDCQCQIFSYCVSPRYCAIPDF